MLTPRPKIYEKCLEKPKIFRPGFLKSRFYTFFDNELLRKIHQQLKKFLKLILITFSAKETPSYRNGKQKRNGVCGHHTPLGKIGLRNSKVPFNSFLNHINP